MGWNTRTDVLAALRLEMRIMYTKAKLRVRLFALLISALSSRVQLQIVGTGEFALRLEEGAPTNF